MMAPFMKGRDAMRSSGRGRRTAAAIMALSLALSLPLSLALFPSSSFASDKDSARRTESASSTIRSGDSRHAPPATKSLPKSSPGRSGRLEAYPSISGVTDPTRDEKLLLELVNVERTSRKLKPLAWDGLLSGLARMHAADMRSMGKTSHESSADGATFRTRLARTPYRASAAAENLAYNANVLKAHRALMASPGHRKNILDPGLTALGLAVLVDTKDDWVWVVEDFATPMAHVSDEEAKELMQQTLTRSRSWRRSLPEDKALSRKLGELVEEMAESGSVRNGVGSIGGEGWTLAFTALDPTQPPPSALERAKKADAYALAVTFRKTPRYPFGAYWAILYLKGAF